MHLREYVMSLGINWLDLRQQPIDLSKGYQTIQFYEARKVSERG